MTNTIDRRKYLAELRCQRDADPTNEDVRHELLVCTQAHEEMELLEQRIEKRWGMPADEVLELLKNYHG